MQKQISPCSPGGGARAKLFGLLRAYDAAGQDLTGEFSGESFPRIVAGAIISSRLNGISPAHRVAAAIVRCAVFYLDEPPCHRMAEKCHPDSGENIRQIASVK
jgi:hypothetical protein